MPKTWQEKAEWLRVNGYPLTVDAYGLGETQEQWRASIGGEGRRYAPTIEQAIEQVYEWVAKE